MLDGKLRAAIGATIHTLRTRRKMSQAGLAKQVGVTRQCVSLWEVGVSAPTIDSIPAVAEALGTRTVLLVSAACKLAGVP